MPGKQASGSPEDGEPLPYGYESSCTVEDGRREEAAFDERRLGVSQHSVVCGFDIIAPSEYVCM